MTSLDKLINKATDETLTSDNWQYNLDVCDYISANPEEATKQAIKFITIRLNLKDANVILRTLSLLVAIAENCGSRMKQEIATKSFLQDCLLKRLGDKKLHKTVKYAIADVVKQLNQSFKSDPSLKPMTDAYDILARDYRQYLQGAGGSGPAKPDKTQMSHHDKAKEDEDLQRVLKLSLQEYEREQLVKKAYLDKPLPETKPTANSGDDGEEKTIATVSKVRALYDLISYEPDELSFRKGDIITVIESVYRDWWRGSLANGKVGIFPLNYVTPIINKSPKEIAEELDQENLILAQLKKIDRLLALLSGPGADEDEVNGLYNEILPLRPSLAKSIEKYSVRKEELMALNSQLNGQVKYYNELTDNVINLKTRYQATGQAPYPQWGAGGYPPAAMPPQSSGMPTQRSGMPPQPSGMPPQSSNQGQLPMQPTSNGFGNERYDQNQNPYTQNQHTYPQAQHPHPQAQYLNVNSFPSVNNL